MNRSGRFQIAFDHDKNGLGGSSSSSSGGGSGGSGGSGSSSVTVKAEMSEDSEDARWIHEQRLEIDHPHYFCGQGSNPPHGVDDSRVRGAWYLHVKEDVAPAGGGEVDSEYPHASDRLCV